MKAGRPAPWMIFRLMELTGVFPAAAVVKVGDTVPDIEEGRNAGAWAVGVTETGSEVGLTLEEWKAIPRFEQSRRADAAGEKLRRAGAHAVIGSVAELPTLIEELESRIRGGERPSAPRKRAAQSHRRQFSSARPKAIVMPAPPVAVTIETPGSGSATNCGSDACFA